MGQVIFKRMWAWLMHTRLYIRALGKWISLAVVTGLACGVVGSAFHIGVEGATMLRQLHPWLLWCLPAAGLLVVSIYKLTGTEGQGTNDIIDQVHLGKGLSLLLLPAIFLGTVLTHLCGGSAGREGAALQMGGTLGYHTGLLFHLDDRDLRTATMTGMAAFFAALFGTPLAATVFAMMVISIGVIYHAAFIPCLTASLVAYGVSILMGVEPTHFAMTAPELELWMLVRVAVLAALCALVCVLLCGTLHTVEKWMHAHLANPWLRILAGGAAVVALTHLCGTTDYNGATFGCAVGPLLGIPAEFAAAIGLVAVFCGAVNCPLASIFLSVELFGDGGLLYFALACGISYMLSGYNGLYSSQTILYSKLKAEYINVHTNSQHAGRPHAKPPTRGSLRDWPE